MFGLGAGETLLILFAAIILIGPRKLPELAKSLGRGIREFQKAKNGIMSDPDVSTEQEGKRPSSGVAAKKEQKNDSHDDGRHLEAPIIASNFRQQKNVGTEVNAEEEANKVKNFQA